jgi:hypothetical protein
LRTESKWWNIRPAAAPVPEKNTMMLIVVYLALIVTGTAISYGIGYAIESASSPGVSLLAFLSMYFLSLVVSWFIAVRLTAPKSKPA